MRRDEWEVLAARIDNTWPASELDHLVSEANWELLREYGALEVEDAIERLAVEGAEFAPSGPRLMRAVELERERIGPWIEARAALRALIRRWEGKLTPLQAARDGRLPEHEVIAEVQDQGLDFLASFIHQVGLEDLRRLDWTGPAEVGVRKLYEQHVDAWIDGQRRRRRIERRAAPKQLADIEALALGE